MLLMIQFKTSEIGLIQLKRWGICRNIIIWRKTNGLVKTKLMILTSAVYIQLLF